MHMKGTDTRIAHLKNARESELSAGECMDIRAGWFNKCLRCKTPNFSNPRRSTSTAIRIAWSR